MGTANLRGQEFTQSSDNVADQIRHVMERFDRRFTFDNPRLVERYLEGELSISIRFLVDGFPEEFVAHLQGTKFSDGSDDDRPKQRVVDSLHVGQDRLRIGLSHAVGHGSEQRCNVETNILRDCEHQQMVFVGIVHVLELPKRVPLPVFVRLSCVNCFYDFLPNALYVSSSRGLVIRGAGTDGEIHAVLRRRRAAASENKLIGDLVERSSEILDYIGGDSCKRVWNVSNTADVVNSLSDLRCIFLEDCIGVGFDEFSQPKLKILEVLFGPCNFCSDAVDDGRHSRAVS
jgi:hypothetical protein